MFTMHADHSLVFVPSLWGQHTKDAKDVQVVFSENGKERFKLSVKMTPIVKMKLNLMIIRSHHAGAPGRPNQEI